MNIIDEYTRRIEFLAYCLSKKSNDMGLIMKKYKVSERTLRRDISYFKSKGVDICTRKQKIEVSENTGNEVLYTLCNDYLQLKLQPDFFLTQIKELSSITNDYFQNLVLITQAISESKPIKIKYRKADDDEDESVLNPLRLVLASEYDWQLHGVKKGEELVKLFYLSRMKNVELQSAYFLKEKQPARKEKLYNITLKFNHEMYNEIYDKVWFAEKELVNDKDGFILLQTRQPITNRLAAWCLTWWDSIEIIHPQELKDYIDEMIEAFKGRNK